MRELEVEAVSSIGAVLSKLCNFENLLSLSNFLFDDTLEIYGLWNYVTMIDHSCSSN